MSEDNATRKSSFTATNTCLRCENQLNMDKQDGLSSPVVLPLFSSVKDALVATLLPTEFFLRKGIGQ